MHPLRQPTAQHNGRPLPLVIESQLTPKAITSQVREAYAVRLGGPKQRDFRRIAASICSGIIAQDPDFEYSYVKYLWTSRALSDNKAAECAARKVKILSRAASSV